MVRNQSRTAICALESDELSRLQGDRAEGVQDSPLAALLKLKRSVHSPGTHNISRVRFLFDAAYFYFVADKYGFRNPVLYSSRDSEPKCDFDLLDEIALILFSFPTSFKEMHVYLPFLSWSVVF